MGKASYRARKSQITSYTLESRETAPCWLRSAPNSFTSPATLQQRFRSPARSDQNLHVCHEFPARQGCSKCDAIDERTCSNSAGVKLPNACFGQQRLIHDRLHSQFQIFVDRNRFCHDMTKPMDGVNVFSLRSHLVFNPSCSHRHCLAKNRRPAKFRNVNAASFL